MTVAFLRSDFLSLVSCLLSVPIVQVFGLYLRDQPSLSSGSSLFRVSLFGGVRHLVFTLVSWLLWTVSLVFATPIVNPSFIAIQPTHVRVLHGAAVALSVVSLFFNIKAIFLFDSPTPKKHPNPKRKKRAMLKRWMSPDVGFVTVLVLGLILSIMAAVFVSVTDTLPDTPSKLLYCSISVICSLTAASTTHGLGGFLRHGRNDRSKPTWRFFQPFVGGRVFIATQALGWSLFSLSLVFFIAVVQQIVKGVAFALRIWALASGGTAVITQVVLGLSVLTFRPGSTERWLPYLKNEFMENLPVLLMYTPVHLLCTVWVISFTFFPARPTLLFWTLCLSVYYCYSDKGNPKHTGSRRWPWFQATMALYIERSLQRWFGSVEVINSNEKKLDPDQKYIYGYHPHGMYPTGAGYLHTLPQFRKTVCDHTPTSLCATALFIPPLLRDVLCWNGFRDVSRSTFKKTLSEERSVMICPGGQEELVETYRSMRDPKEIVLCSRHKGFCRMAIEQQAALVPVLSLGEIFTMQNAFNIPFLQKVTYKWIGFPIPYLLVGRWLLSPLPKKVPLMYVVGAPIQPPKVKPDDPNYEEELNKLHQKYFGSLTEMFQKHKDDHPFYSNAKVVIQ